MPRLGDIVRTMANPLLAFIDFAKNLDADTMSLLTRFAIRATKSGNANEFVKSRLRRLLDEDDRR